jgi:hypothetical protein
LVLMMLTLRGGGPPVTVPISLPCSAIVCAAASRVLSGIECPAMMATSIWERMDSVGDSD